MKLLIMLTLLTACGVKPVDRIDDLKAENQSLREEVSRLRETVSFFHTQKTSTVDLYKNPKELTDAQGWGNDPKITNIRFDEAGVICLVGKDLDRKCFWQGSIMAEDLE
jgi:hypothetical protein